jgi:hypothetical protein
MRQGLPFTVTTQVEWQYSQKHREQQMGLQGSGWYVRKFVPVPGGYGRGLLYVVLGSLTFSSESSSMGRVQ